LIENLAGNALDFDLRAGIAAAAVLQPVACGPAVQAEVLNFVNGRLEGLLRDQGRRASVVKAVLAEQSHNPYAAMQTAVALEQAITTTPDWEALLDAYARCVRITRSQPQQFGVRPADFALPVEQTLWQAYETAAAGQDGRVATLVATLRDLQTPINQFFNDVLVMDEDPRVRENRLALLQRIAALAHGIADLSQLEGF
jgi:glycyl-tRNA synthetase